MDYSTITFEVKDRIAVITFNRPAVLNALNAELIEDLWNAFEAVSADEEIRVLLADDHTIVRQGLRALIAVPVTRITRRYEKVKDVSDLPEILVSQIEHFFAHYQDLESGKWAKTAGIGDHKEAEKLITEAIERAETET